MKRKNNRFKKKPNVNSTLPDQNSIRGNLYLTHNDTRDLETVYGYKKEPNVIDFTQRVERQHIANRIVKAFPKACWASSPLITNDQDKQEESIFELQVKELFQDLKIYSYIRRADIMANIGTYSILYIKVNDGRDPKDELVATNLKKEDISFIAPYDEQYARITKYYDDVTNPKFGLPEIYSITTGGYINSTKPYGSTTPGETVIEVHESRIIHIADNLLNNELFGIPILKPVFDLLTDLMKITGGSAETFYLNSRGGLSLEADANQAISDEDDLPDHLQDYSNGMTRYLLLQGMKTNVIEFEVADPSNNIDMIMTLISSATEIPKRILTGSEMGQLASSQDEKNFNNKVRERQNDFCENTILRPLVDFFIKVGILPDPGRYSIIWDDLNVLSEVEKAEVALKLSSAVQNYTNARGSENVMPVRQFMEDVIGMEYREEETIELDALDLEDGQTE